MALRPIDNALPITHERPKKQPKIAVATQKQQPERASLNDENHPLPSSGEATIDYITSDNLKPLSEPESKIHCLVEDLESKNWIKVCESLNDARRFALYHSSLLFAILEKVVLVVTKTMKNPRSALCKTSIMAASDIFSAFGDKLLEPSTSDAFDGMLLQLLLKASQDKRFVCEEADRALGSMVGSMTPLPLLRKLRAYVGHSNLRVRAKAAVSLSNCVTKMGLQEMEEFGFSELIEVAADLLNDRLPEARDAARSIATSVYEALTKDVEEKMEDGNDDAENNNNQRTESGLTEDNADNEHDAEKKKLKNMGADELKTYVEGALLHLQTKFKQKTDSITAMIDVMESKVIALEDGLIEFRSELGDETPPPSPPPPPPSVPEKENTPSASGVKPKD